MIAVESVYDRLVEALAAHGGVLLDAADEARALERTMFAGGTLSSAFIAQSAPAIASLAGLARPALAQARFLMVAQTGVGSEHPFSGEKLSPVLALYRAADFAAARRARAASCCDYQGAGHSIGLHTRDDGPRAAARAHATGLPCHRQPGALLRDRRQLRQRAAVFAVDGLRNVGRQQHLRQSRLPPLPEHHARRASTRARARARADRRRAVRPQWRVGSRTCARAQMRLAEHFATQVIDAHADRSRRTVPASRPECPRPRSHIAVRDARAPLCRALWARLAGGIEPGMVSFMLENGMRRRRSS